MSTLIKSQSENAHSPILVTALPSISDGITNSVTPSVSVKPVISNVPSSRTIHLKFTVFSIVSSAFTTVMPTGDITVPDTSDTASRNASIFFFMRTLLFPLQLNVIFC